MTQPIRGYMTRAEGDGLFTFTFVTEGVKPDGMELKIDGMRTDDYLGGNPVVLWVHDYWGERLPIGKTTGIKRFKTKAKARIQFDMADPFAVQVARKYEDGFLNTVSVGWDILQIDDDRQTVTDWNVLDISAVPVPGDSKALVDRQKAALRSLSRDMVEQVAPDDTALVRLLGDDEDEGEWLTPPGAVHIACKDHPDDGKDSEGLLDVASRLLPAAREGEGLLAAAVALKDAAQQVIDSHNEDDPDPKPEPIVKPVVEPVVEPVVNPVAEVLKGLQEVLGASEGNEGADDD